VVVMCEVAPYWFSALYRYAHEGALGGFNERLERLGVDREWLKWVSDRYRLMGDAHAAGTAPIAVVDERHAQLASWFLLGQRGSPSLPTWEAEAEIQVRAATLGPVDSPEDYGVIVCWNLGRPVSRSDWGPLPAVPALKPSDTDLKLAFAGLLDHARLICSDGAMAELGHTAVLWRITALIEGLLPVEHGPSPQNRLSRLITERLAAWMMDSEILAFRRSCEQLDADRNVLSHLRADTSGRDFTSVVGDFADVSALVSRTASITAAIFDQAADESMDLDASSLWDSVDADLRGYEWLEDLA
jgi:hypothetical protein